MYYDNCLSIRLPLHSHIILQVLLFICYYLIKQHIINLFRCVVVDFDMFNWEKLMMLFLKGADPIYWLSLQDLV